MSKEERAARVEQAKARYEAKKKSKKSKGNIFKRIARWFREMKSELKKVVWPTPKQIMKNTLVVLFVVAVSAVIVWGFDWVASHAVQLLIELCHQ